MVNEVRPGPVHPPKGGASRRRRVRRLSRTPVRRLVQAAALLLFLHLFLHASWPYAGGFSGDALSRSETVPVELFLWLDPLVGLSAALAARAWNVALIGGAAVLALGMLLPRGFCGYLCPFGTLLDLADVATGRLRRKGRAAVPSPGGEVAGRRWTSVRFVLLAAVIGAALGGVLLSGFVAALPVLTRGLLFTAGRLELGLLKNWGMVAPADAGMVLSLALFSSALLLGLAGPRFWCRHLCPSGALLSLPARLRLVRRTVGGACTRCGRCARECPFGAIGPDAVERPMECASCRTCSGVCPEKAVRFGIAPGGAGAGAAAPADAPGGRPSRRAFLASIAAGAGTAAAVQAVRGHRPPLLRPPGSVEESAFLGLCVRCGQCVQVCPGPVLRLAGFAEGLEALWTPVAVPSHAGCHPACTACTQACPTRAIRPLTPEAKRRTRMGLAIFDTALCLPHRGERDCRLCADECDAAGYRAIEMRPIRLAVGEAPEGVLSALEIEEMGRIQAPFLKADACVGCGLCEYRCHVANVRQRRLLERSAVVVDAGPADRPAPGA